MGIVNSSETRLAVIAETVWGTTPATPTFKNLRFTGESLSINRQTVSSDDIRPDRNVSDLTQVGGSAEGDINFDLSYGGAGSAFDTLLESFMHAAWASDVIKNGVTQKSVTLEKTFEAGTTDIFYRLTGMVANQFSLSCTAGQKVTGSFSFQGKGGSVSNAIIAGATYAAAPTGGVINAATGFAGLSVTGLTSPKIRSLSFQAQNNLRGQQALGSVDNVGVGAGRVVITGSLEMYLEDSSLLDLYLNGTGAGLAFTLGQVTAEKYAFIFPAIKFTTCQVVAGGNDQDVIVNAGWQAIYDAGTSASMQITRAVS